MANNNNKIEQLFGLNKCFSEEIQSSLPTVVESLKKSKFKYTGKALVAFIPKSGYLNSAILELSVSKNVYAAAVLYRSIIEHSFRHLYIYAKTLEDNNDGIGKKYCRTLKASEDLQWFDKINKHERKFGTNKTVWNTKGDHNELIRSVKKEFLFSKIVEYFKSSNFSDNKEIKQFINDHLLNKGIEYDNLSSAVHGGPFGESALFNLHKDKKKHNDTLYKFASESFGLHHSIVESTYLFAYLMDEEMKEHYESITALRK